MLPKSRRIRSREYPSGPGEAAYASKALRIKVFKGLDRAAIIVPKKVDARATVRNSIRRQLAAVLEKNRFLGKDILVFVSPEAKKMPKTELAADFGRLLGQIK